MKKAQREIETFKALALLADLQWSEAHELPNGYWPETESYAEVRANSPWLLLTCEGGSFTFGWRKRVLQVSWTVGDVDPIEDESLKWITHDARSFHAYNMVQALTFLTTVTKGLGVSNA